MKYLVGCAVLALSFATPSFAQSHSAGGGGTGFPVSGGGGGGTSDASASSRLPHYSRAKFQVAAVSGTETDYMPSTFVPYNKAVTKGHVTPASAPQTLGQAAQLNRETPKVKAKFALVQDSHGNPVIEPR